LVTLLIFENSSHRQIATGRRPDQIDRNVSCMRRTQPSALLVAEIVNAPFLQPGAVFETCIDTVHLRQFLQGGFE
jgi:hypothetical protein